ncbi:MAG: hypothetical protein M3Y33_19620, partial [Actinomycetota bacterium]|nr:hypothetical protein [Actinomycetota bacterium]
PGVGAHVFQVPLSASGQSITMRPPGAGLTGPGLVYPVYIDPSFQADPVGGEASHWTQIDQGFPTTSYWDESSDLQVGECDNSAGGCNGVGVARSYFRLPVSTALTTSTSINSADVSMDDVWSDSCTAEPVQLWTTAGIGESTTWNSPASFNAELQSQSFAFGFGSSCGSFKDDVTWNVTSTIQADAGKVSNQTFGMKAGSESSTLDWKQFDSGSASITMSTQYHNPPAKPSSLANAPAGACATSGSSPATIGNDDVTLSATVGDVDDANGDSSLSSSFVLKNYPSGTTATTVHVSSGNTVGRGQGVGRHPPGDHPGAEYQRLDDGVHLLLVGHDQGRGQPRADQPGLGDLLLHLQPRGARRPRPHAEPGQRRDRDHGVGHHHPAVRLRLRLGLRALPDQLLRHPADVLVHRAAGGHLDAAVDRQRLRRGGLLVAGHGLPVHR